MLCMLCPSLSYIPVLMAQARIYWDLADYQQVEKIFRKSVEFCSEHDVWKLNVAHVLFMQVRRLPVFMSVMFIVYLPTFTSYDTRRQNLKKQLVSMKPL